MGLIYYIYLAVYGNGTSLPPDETISLLKALQVKKETFRMQAQQIVVFDDIAKDDTVVGNSITLRLGTKSYSCSEYTYYNSLLDEGDDYEYHYGRRSEKKNIKLTYEKYKSYSRPLKESETDLGYHRGYCGSSLNYYGCLLKLIEDLPDYTLIESNGRFIDNRLIELFQFYGDYKPEFWKNINFNNYSAHGYSNIEEYIVFQKLATAIRHLCEKKNIYFDINPYNTILLCKEPIETWINTQDFHHERNARYNFIKYEDTYIDGHRDFHEESEPVKIIEKKISSRSHRFLDRKYYEEYITYDVTYEDGVKGQIYTRHTESYD